MTPVLLVLYVFFGVALFCGVIGFLLYRSMFKHTAMIARQTGNDPSDVVWLRDKFRVINRDGLRVIKFWRLQQKTSSVPGSFWTKFLKKEKKALQYTSEEWSAAVLGPHLKRGLFFYETSEGELSPMRIEQKGGNHVFSVISQDNKQFLVNELKDINNLTRNKTKDLFVLGGIVVACLVLAIIFIFGIIYMSETAKNTAAQATSSCVEIWQQMSQGNMPPTFAENIQGAVGG